MPSVSSLSSSAARSRPSIFNLLQNDAVMHTEPPTPADECGGCLNGGICVTRVCRGRVINRCSCPANYGGGHCQIEY